jgi:hypothetical protein
MRGFLLVDPFVPARSTTRGKRFLTDRDKRPRALQLVSGRRGQAICPGSRLGRDNGAELSWWLGLLPNRAELLVDLDEDSTKMKRQTHATLPKAETWKTR